MTKKMEEQLAKLIDSSQTVQDKLKDIDARLSRMETLEKSVQKLQTTSKKLREDVDNLLRRDNDREQRDRNHSIRVFGLTISEEEKTKPLKIMKNLYDNILSPILQIAVDEGEIAALPPMLDLLETAHILPQGAVTNKAKTRSNDKVPLSQTIARFKSRPFRALIFQYKRSFFQANKNSKISIVEDLTKYNYNKLQEMKKNIDIAAAWTINGTIRYKTIEDETKILKLKNNFDDFITA